MTEAAFDTTSVPTVEEIRNITDTRNRLIAAGARLIVDGGLATLATGISPDSVTRLAGRTRRVFYDHFATKEDFIKALCAFYLADHEHQKLTSGDLVAEMATQAEGDLVKSTELFTKLAFERGVRSERDIICTLAGSLATDPETRHLLSQRSARVESALATLVSNLVEHWGLPLREPWTPEQLGCVLYALADGMFRRSQSGSEIADAQTYALATLTLLPVVTQRPSEPPASVFQHLDRLSHQVSASWRERSIPGETTNARERVIEAFLSVIADHGPQEAHIDEISQRSGVSEETVVAVFGDIHGVLAATLEDVMPSLQAEAEFDLTSDAISIDAAVHRHLLRAGQWIVDHPMLITSVVVIGARKTNGAVADATSEMMAALTRPLQMLLGEGQKRGVLAQDADIAEAASMAAEVMIGRGSAMPGFDHERCADLMTKWIMKSLS